MPKTPKRVNVVSSSSAGLNQTSVTTRHAESPEEKSARAIAAALSLRTSITDYERAKVFQRFHDRHETADKRRGRKANKLLQPLTAKNAMKELGYLSKSGIDIIHTGEQDARFHLYHIIYRVLLILLLQLPTGYT